MLVMLFGKVAIACRPQGRETTGSGETAGSGDTTGTGDTTGSGDTAGTGRGARRDIPIVTTMY
jgi:hypothetical protein